MAKKRAKKKSSWKVGQTKVKMRKVNGKNRKVKVTKLSKGREKVRVISKKKKK